MDRNDQQAIESLFGKLATVEQQAAPRDAEAETFIRDQISRQPGAPYYMAQTIVVQEQALQAAQARIEELEQQPAQGSGGGLFSGIFGGGNQPRRSGSVPSVGRSAAAGERPDIAPRQGGGFLAGAAQTAMGVAGGLLLGNAIGGMFGGNEAQAAETQEPADDAAAQDDGGFFGGGDDFSDF